MVLVPKQEHLVSSHHINNKVLVITHHLLYFLLRHWNGQTPHDVVEIFSGDEVLVQFVLLSAKICREGFCAAKYL